MIAQESKYKAAMTSAGVHSDTLSPSSFIDEKKREKREKIEIKDNISTATSCTFPSTFSKGWIGLLPTYGLDDAVELHTQTMMALKNKSKWSIVAVPYNITGPPVDIAALHLEDEREEEERTKNDMRGREGREGREGGGGGGGGGGRRRGNKARKPFSSLATAWADGKIFLTYQLHFNFILLHSITF